MSIDKLTTPTQPYTPALSNVETSAAPSAPTKADAVAQKSFASKSVSLIGCAIKSGAKITVKGTIAIGKLTVLAARKVGSAFASAIKSAREKLSTGKVEKPPKSRQIVKIEKVKEAQKNLVAAVRNGKETIAKQKAAQKKRREIANLERRAKALKSDSTVPSKKPNQDYTNFEKSKSTLSANTALTSKDKQDIAELEARLANLRKP